MRSLIGTGLPSPLPMLLLALSLLLLTPLWAATPRHRETVQAYRRTHPCPATQKTTGACPGWRVDHLIPLCAGGADDPSNMIWQPYAESLEKDRLEVALCRYIERERKRKL